MMIQRLVTSVVLLAGTGMLTACDTPVEALSKELGVLVYYADTNASNTCGQRQVALWMEQYQSLSDSKKASIRDTVRSKVQSIRLDANKVLGSQHTQIARILEFAGQNLSIPVVDKSFQEVSVTGDMSLPLKATTLAIEGSQELTIKFESKTVSETSSKFTTRLPLIQAIPYIQNINSMGDLRRGINDGLVYSYSSDFSTSTECGQMAPVTQIDSLN